MNTFILLLCLAVAGHALDEVTRFVLNSPRETVQLYQQFKSKEHLRFNRGEEGKRFRQFKRNAKLVARLNDESDSVTFALNMFSTMTNAEKKMYTGLNITGHFAHPPMLSSGLQSVPSQKLWTAEGAVTAAINQDSCGSCWTFGAVAGLETRYKIKSGVLRKFSEQEYLDCVYEGKRDGCQGGWPDDGYTYSKNRGGQLASSANYPYVKRDGTCQRNRGNAAIAFKINGFQKVGGTEAENIAALSQGSLSVAFEVTTYLQQYSKGIMKDTTCSGSPNHAVAAVGYTPQYVLVKNSWGVKWGEQGFIRFARNHGNCGLFKYSSFPVLTATGYSDTTASDKAAVYTPGDNSDSGGSSGGNSSCKDKAVDCSAWMCPYAHLKTLMQEYCQKTCKYCTDNSSGACASGTVRCSDGVCRHSHMCNHG